MYYSRFNPLYKKLQTRYNKGVQANCKAKGEKMHTDMMRFSDFKNFLPSLFLLIYSGLKIRYEQRD